MRVGGHRACSMCPQPVTSLDPSPSLDPDPWARPFALLCAGQNWTTINNSMVGLEMCETAISQGGQAATDSGSTAVETESPETEAVADGGVPHGSGSNGGSSGGCSGGAGGAGGAGGGGGGSNLFRGIIAVAAMGWDYMWRAMPWLRRRVIQRHRGSTTADGSIFPTLGLSADGYGNCGEAEMAVVMIQLAVVVASQVAAALPPPPPSSCDTQSEIGYSNTPIVSVTLAAETDMATVAPVAMTVAVATAEGTERGAAVVRAAAVTPLSTPLRQGRGKMGDTPEKLFAGNDWDISPGKASKEVQVWVAAAAAAGGKATLSFSARKAPAAAAAH